MSAAHLPDFTSRTDSNGDEWPDTFGYESDAGRWFNPSEWLAPAYQMANSVRQAGLSAFRPRGSFDAVSHQCEVWARYIGTDDDGGVA